MPDTQPPRSLERYVPIDHTQVSFDGGFWASWTETVRKVTVPSQHRRLEEERFLEVLNFDQPPGPLARPVQLTGLSMQHFFDSDFGKWIEAASYTLKNHPNPELEVKIDEIVEKLAQGQMTDGYLNSWFIRREPEKRWTNLRDWHEMYSMGHLLEGAIAYYQATGKRRFLDIMLRAVDHIIDTFGPEPDKLRGYDAHAEIEIALVKLHRITGDQRHLDLAAFFVKERGRMPSYYDEEARRRGEDPATYHFQTYAYSQAHMPVLDQTEVVGHAVRATYLFSALCDLAYETDDTTMLAAGERLFDNLTQRQMYVTGGIGPAHVNEGFTREYDLPNESAYAETCAAVALAFWASRMGQIRLDRKFTDHVELVLYNGALSGIARDGAHYFYENVLESHGQHRRWKWHYCPCCPTNIARLLASLGSYFYASKGNELVVHLYGANSAAIVVDGVAVQLVQTTSYPWSGAVQLAVDPSRNARFSVRLRIPGWCRRANVSVNGEPVDLEAIVECGYATITREWAPGDCIIIDFAMPVERLHAHPAVGNDGGRTALMRGPVVYCAEEVDLGFQPQSLRLAPSDAITATYDPALLGGAVILEGTAQKLDEDEWGTALYRAHAPALKETAFNGNPLSSVGEPRCRRDARVARRT